MTQEPAIKREPVVMTFSTHDPRTEISTAPVAMKKSKQCKECETLYKRLSTVHDIIWMVDRLKNIKHGDKCEILRSARDILTSIMFTKAPFCDCDNQAPSGLPE